MGGGLKGGRGAKSGVYGTHICMLHTGVKAIRKCVCVSGFGGAAGHEDSSGEETDEDEEDATYQGIPDQVTLEAVPFQ